MTLAMGRMSCLGNQERHAGGWIPPNRRRVIGMSTGIDEGGGLCGAQVSTRPQAITTSWSEISPSSWAASSAHQVAVPRSPLCQRIVDTPVLGISYSQYALGAASRPPGASASLGGRLHPGSTPECSRRPRGDAQGAGGAVRSSPLRGLRSVRSRAITLDPLHSGRGNHLREPNPRR